MTTTHLSPISLPTAMPASARAVLQLLPRLQHGTLQLQLPDGNRLQFGSGAARASLHLHNWNFCAAVLRSGDIGAAESFIAGDWSTPDLRALLKLFVANRDAVQALVYGRWWGSLAHRLRHLLNRNSRRGSRRNIHAHYDLGNDFYKLWLDPGLSYSSAWFDGQQQRGTVQAQQVKMQRALSECGVRNGSRVLEVGCGWGGLAECAAGDFGARVTALSLSKQQLLFAQRRLQRAGLDQQVQLRYQDYREAGHGDEAGSFDAIVSIEMFEAVGQQYWGEYFAMLQRCLRPGGRACIQSITIRDDLFERYRRGTDFIQQYIFPGGLLPSAERFRQAAATAGLRVVNELDFGLDYAETLRRWSAAFAAAEPQVRLLGFDTGFIRTWAFYLAYSEAAFTHGNTSVRQFTLQRD